jgi:hypothetical protein
LARPSTSPLATSSTASPESSRCPTTPPPATTSNRWPKSTDLRSPHRPPLTER